MLKEVYKYLLDRLIAIDGMKYVDFYNGQYMPDQEGKSLEFNRPAVFIEFTPMEMEQENMRIQETEANIRFHIVTENYNEANSLESDTIINAALAHFDMMDAVHKSLTGYSESIFNALSRTMIEPMVVADELYVHIVTYHTRMIDASAKRAYIKKTPTPELKITTSLNIPSE